jgi:Flp pilus assembly protein TadD
MALTARRAVAFAWPGILLVLFVATFRPSADIRADEAAIPSCEDGALPRDAAAVQRCLALDPGDVGLLTDLGAAYESEGRSDRAEEIYRRALGLDPRDGEVHLRLGRLLLARGDRAGAKTEGEAALRWQPGAAAAGALVAAAGTPQ